MLPRLQPHALLGLTWGSLVGALWVAAAALPLWVAAPFATHFTGRPDEDAASAFELLLRIPLWSFLLTLLLTAQLLGMLLWGGRHWFDPAGMARDALYWVFRARTRLALLFTLAWMPLLLMRTKAEAVPLALDLLAGAAIMLAPFFLWSPRSVAAPVAFHAARPGWPGLRTLVLCLGLDAALLGLRMSVPDQGALWTEPLVWILGAVVWTIQANLWLVRAGPRWSALRSSVMWPGVSACCWQIAVIQALGLAMLAPLLFQAVFAYYVAPQIDYSTRTLNLDPPALLVPLATLGSWLETGFLIFLPTYFVLQMALGRLVHVSRQATHPDSAGNASN